MTLTNVAYVVATFYVLVTLLLVRGAWVMRRRY